MPNPVVFAATDTTTPAYDRVPLTIDADIDFTDPDGPTAGFCPRALYATGAGTIVMTMVGPAGGSGVAPPTPVARTVAFNAGETIWAFVTSITDSGTSATGVVAIL